jgi:gliding motility-associated-like protein
MTFPFTQYVFLLLAALGFAIPLRAGHIVGGEMFYESLGNNQYVFFLHLYRDCNASGPNVAQSFDNPANITVYRGNQLVDTFRVALFQEVNIPPILNEPCVTPPSGICVNRGIYRFTLTLPPVPEGYTVVHQRCCRNNTISNIVNPGDMGASFYVTLTQAALLAGNSSPRFNDFPPIVICNQLPLTFDHSATDANGNTLTYELCGTLTGGGPDITSPGNLSFFGVTPFPASPPPYTSVTYLPPYNALNPMGGTPPLSIDPTTGVISGRPNALGQFVVTVCVNEFNAAGTLLSTIRRDFQFNVYNCQINVFADILETSAINAEELLLQQCGDSTSVTFVNQSGQPQNINAYEWQFDLGNGNVFSSTEVNPTVVFPSYGTYEVLLIANPGNVGCTDSVSIVLEIYPSLNADFTFVQDSCVHDTIPFTDLSFSTGGAAVVDWNWRFGDGAVSSLQDPGHFFAQAGEFDVTLIATDANGCRDTAVRSLAYFPAPILDFDLPDFNACEPATLTFINNSLPLNGYSVVWDLGDGTTSTQASPTHTYTSGNYNVAVAISSPTGCFADTAFTSLVVRQSPVAAFSFTPGNPSIFQPTVAFDDQSQFAGEWSWDFGNGDTSQLPDPVYTFPDTGFFEVVLTVTNPSGCLDTAVARIDIEPIYTYFLPNALTPDGDGFNDFFRGEGFFTAINRFDMTIWNRWGELVFQTNDPAQAWNGLQHNTGEPCPAGAYVVLVRIDGPRNQYREIKGFAHLVR